MRLLAENKDDGGGDDDGVNGTVTFYTTATAHYVCQKNFRSIQQPTIQKYIYSDQIILSVSRVRLCSIFFFFTGQCMQKITAWQQRLKGGVIFRVGGRVAEEGREGVARVGYQTKKRVGMIFCGNIVYSSQTVAPSI